MLHGIERCRCIKGKREANAKNAENSQRSQGNSRKFISPYSLRILRVLRVEVFTTLRKIGSNSEVCRATYNNHQMSLPAWLKILNTEVVVCTRCPRLVVYREQIAREKRRAYRDHEYWGKPVPGFGDPQARVMVLGLAPGAHGSNRTGRPFTGDASGKFMYPVLYETGFANQPTAIDREDGLVLTDLYITAAARCAPPDNKPLPLELANCASYLEREIEGLKKLRVVVALGRIGFEAYLNYLIRRKVIAGKREYEFRHGASYAMPDGRVLLASYHPSNQNTQTGKLTREMFLGIFREARRLAQG